MGVDSGHEEGNSSLGEKKAPRAGDGFARGAAVAQTRQLTKNEEKPQLEPGFSKCIRSATRILLKSGKPAQAFSAKS
jgi:hypothetical protein